MSDFDLRAAFEEMYDAGVRSGKSEALNQAFSIVLNNQQDYIQSMMDITELNKSSTEILHAKVVSDLLETAEEVAA